jgi:hypothetical protein
MKLVGARSNFFRFSYVSLGGNTLPAADCTTRAVSILVTEPAACNCTRQRIRTHNDEPPYTYDRKIVDCYGARQRPDSRVDIRGVDSYQTTANE